MKRSGARPRRPFHGEFVTSTVIWSEPKPAAPAPRPPAAASGRRCSSTPGRLARMVPNHTRASAARRRTAGAGGPSRGGVVHGPPPDPRCWPTTSRRRGRVLFSGCPLAGAPWARRRLEGGSGSWRSCTTVRPDGALVAASLRRALRARDAPPASRRGASRSASLDGTRSTTRSTTSRTGHSQTLAACATCAPTTSALLARHYYERLGRAVWSRRRRSRVLYDGEPLSTCWIDRYRHYREGGDGGRSAARRVRRISGVGGSRAAPARLAPGGDRGASATALGHGLDLTRAAPFVIRLGRCVPAGEESAVPAAQESEPATRLRVTTLGGRSAGSVTLMIPLHTGPEQWWSPACAWVR